MGTLDHLEPRGVFHFFEELCAIPRGSGNTGAVSDWCVAFARASGVWSGTGTSADNVILVQEATPGYEGAEPVILQGHLDMVCEQEPGCHKDMAPGGPGPGGGGGLRPGAKGTTLGGRRRHRRGHGPGACWTTRTSPTPGWRWCSPPMRRWA